MLPIAKHNEKILPSSSKTKEYEYCFAKSTTSFEKEVNKKVDFHGTYRN